MVPTRSDPLLLRLFLTVVEREIQHAVAGHYLLPRISAGNRGIDLRFGRNGHSRLNRTHYTMLKISAMSSFRLPGYMPWAPEVMRGCFQPGISLNTDGLLTGRRLS